MQNWLLEDIGNDLAKKPFERMSWWWGPKWVDFINADLPLTVDNPLWLREEISLKSVRLFELHPDELQAEIIYYCQQPFWKRWLLDLFTPIQNKIKLWSYYQRCLSFRKVFIEYPFVAKERIAFTSEQDMVRKLTHQFNRSRIRLENYLEKRAGNLKWVQNNLDILLTNFLKKGWRFNLKLMKKKLTKLPSKLGEAALQNQLEKEYHRFERILHQYLSTWCKNTFNSLDKTINTPNSDAFVYGYASVRKEQSCSILSIEKWVKRQRQVIDSLLQKKSPEQFLKIKNLLEFCLSTLRLLIDSQIDHYEKKIIDAVLLKQFDCNGIIQKAEILLAYFILFFQKSVLLFCFDNSFENEKLQEIQAELFKAFKELSKESLEKIKESLQTLKDCLPQQPQNTQVPRFWKMKGSAVKLAQKIGEINVRIEQAQAEIDTNFKQTQIQREEKNTKIDKFINPQTYSKLFHKQSSNGFNSTTANINSPRIRYGDAGK